MSSSDKNPGFNIDSFITSNHSRLDENIRKVEAGKYFRFGGALYYVDDVSHMLENVTAHIVIDKSGNFVWGIEKDHFSFKQVVPGLISRKEAEDIIIRTLILKIKKREERIISGILGDDFDLGGKSSPYDARGIRKPTWYGFDDFGGPLPNTPFSEKNFYKIPVELFPKPKPEKINTFDRIIDTSLPPYQKRPK